MYTYASSSVSRSNNSRVESTAEFIISRSSLPEGITANTTIRTCQRKTQKEGSFMSSPKKV